MDNGRFHHLEGAGLSPPARPRKSGPLLLALIAPVDPSLLPKYNSSRELPHSPQHALQSAKGHHIKGRPKWHII